MAPIPPKPSTISAHTPGSGTAAPPARSSVMEVIRTLTAVPRLRSSVKTSCSKRVTKAYRSTGGLVKIGAVWARPENAPLELKPAKVG